MAKTTLITGANRGIGLAIATLAAARGDRVLAAARRPGQAVALQDLARRHRNVSVLNLDVTDPEEMAAAAAAGRTPIDLLICNAGQYVARGGIDDKEYTYDAWHTVMMTNVAGVFFTVRAFLKRLSRAPEPKIAIVSSLIASGEIPRCGNYCYGASKAAAANLARGLAQDLKERGIAVGAYDPGGLTGEAEDSARGLLARFDVLSLATTGVCEDHNGQPIQL